ADRVRRGDAAAHRAGPGRARRRARRGRPLECTRARGGPGRGVPAHRSQARRQRLPRRLRPARPGRPPPASAARGEHASAARAPPRRRPRPHRRPSVEPMPRYAHRVIDAEPLVLVEPHTGEGPASLGDLAGRQLIMLPDTCGLTSFTRSLIADNELPVTAYPGEAGSYRVLEEWSHLGLGSSMLPKSKLASPDAPHREVLDPEGQVLEIFYETVWDPASPIADELEDLADRLVQPKD